MRAGSIFGLAAWLALAAGAFTSSGTADDGTAEPLKIHMLSGSREYKSEESLKEFSRYLEQNGRIEVTASWGDDGATELEDLDALKSADLMLVFARRMKLPEEQMNLIRAHWEAGKPIVGIRTAGHAFQEEDNEVFDRKVLGGHYQGHYGDEPVDVSHTEAGAAHPVLKGVGPFTSRKLYKAGDLADDTVVLQVGEIEEARHPVTIVHSYKGGRTFFTSLGVPEDFQDENFRRMLVNAICWTTHRDPDNLISSGKTTNSQTFDVVVAGATPAGIAAAVNAAREGATVALVEETGHIGGLASGGLSNTDFRSFEALGGTFREFMHRVEQHYARQFGADSQQVRDCVKGGYYEPKVARLVFEQMLDEQEAIQVFLHHRLKSAQTGPADADRNRLTNAVFSDLKNSRTLDLHGTVFIDATYEGDLLAAAGVPYRVGCESKEAYGESLAFDEPNDYVQTYNFRVCLTRDPENRLPIPKPEDYRREDYAMLVDLIEEGRIESWGNPDPRPILKVRPIPNDKADFNDDANCPVSLSLKNVNHDWPEGGPDVRARIFQRYKDYSLGLFWFLTHDPEIPESIRREMAEWGIPKDEYPDTGHWTPALYVREGRRMVGEYVFTEHDTQPTEESVRAPVRRDSVAIGDYSLNCHGVYSPQPGVNVGRIGKAIRPFQVPYPVMLPKETDGLLVPVAVSSSHVGFCALRMEPTWISLGQAAGLAAAMAVRNEQQVRDVDVTGLQLRLHELGAMTVYISDLGEEITVPRPGWDPPGEFTVRLLEVTPASPVFRAAQFFGTRGFFHNLVDPEQADEWRQPRLTGQWRGVFPYHELRPDEPVEEALARQWLEQAAQLGIESSLDPAEAADGKLTRGAFLNRLFEDYKRGGN